MSQKNINACTRAVCLEKYDGVICSISGTYRRMIEDSLSLLADYLCLVLLGPCLGTNSWEYQRPAGVQCAVCSVQCAVCRVQCIVCSVQYAVCIVQYAVCGMQSAVCSVQCAVCSVKRAVFSFHYLVCSVQCAVCTVKYEV